MELSNGGEGLGLEEFRRRLQRRPLEGPWDGGRESIHVLIWCKKSPTGQNVGLTMKCEMLRGSPAPLALGDLDTAKKYVFLVQKEIPAHSVFLICYDKTDVNKSKWPYPAYVKVLFLRPEDVAGVRVSREFEQTLSDGFSLNRHN